MTFRPALFSVATVALLSTTASSSDRDDGRYYQVIYDFEVAAQCGLATPEVEQAFRRGRDREAANSGLGEETLRRLRLRAIAAADREYDNRGLGGHRQWCRGDGRAGVDRLLGR